MYNIIIVVLLRYSLTNLNLQMELHYLLSVVGCPRQKRWYMKHNFTSMKLCVHWIFPSGVICPAKIEKKWTLYTLTSVCTFSTLFSIHFPRSWQREVIEQSRAPLVSDHLLYSSDFNGWYCMEKLDPSHSYRFKGLKKELLPSLNNLLLLSSWAL